MGTACSRFQPSPESSAGGWFELPAESNAFFLRAEHWRALGGWDEGFVTPGGGLVNLDTWSRACADPEAEIIMLLGEATFHQVHGGIATNNPEVPDALFQEEYARLRGHPYALPTRRPLYFGSLPETVKYKPEGLARPRCNVLTSHLARSSGEFGEPLCRPWTDCDNAIRQSVVPGLLHLAGALVWIGSGRSSTADPMRGRENRDCFAVCVHPAKQRGTGLSGARPGSSCRRSCCR